VAFGHFLQLVGDVFESGRPSSGLADTDPQPVPPPPQPPPLRRARAQPPALDLSVSNARKFNWTVAWQRDNPKQEGSDSRDRYAAYCVATALANARILGARTAEILHDHAKGYLRISARRQRTYNAVDSRKMKQSFPSTPDTRSHIWRPSDAPIQPREQIHHQACARVPAHFEAQQQPLQAPPIRPSPNCE
jgi:hypothetical protein